MLAFRLALWTLFSQAITFRQSGKNLSRRTQPSLCSIRTLQAEQPRVRLRQVKSAAASNPELSEAEGLGQKVSILYRIEGDPDHPFSEVVGVVQRIECPDGGRAVYHVLRRSGEMVPVRASDVVKLRVIPT